MNPTTQELEDNADIAEYELLVILNQGLGLPPPIKPDCMRERLQNGVIETRRSATNDERIRKAHDICQITNRCNDCCEKLSDIMAEQILVCRMREVDSDAAYLRGFR